MLRYLNQCSRGRGAWLLMAFTALALELVALWFQHVMLLKPCVLCIYERCALFGIMGAGLVGAIAPKTPLRYVALIDRPQYLKGYAEGQRKTCQQNFAYARGVTGKTFPASCDTVENASQLREAWQQGADENAGSTRLN